MILDLPSVPKPPPISRPTIKRTKTKGGSYRKSTPAYKNRKEHNGKYEAKNRIIGELRNALVAQKERSEALLLAASVATNAVGQTHMPAYGMPMAPTPMIQPPNISASTTTTDKVLGSLAKSDSRTKRLKESRAAIFAKRAKKTADAKRAKKTNALKKISQSAPKKAPTQS